MLDNLEALSAIKRYAWSLLWFVDAAVCGFKVRLPSTFWKKKLRYVTIFKRKRLTGRYLCLWGLFGDGESYLVPLFSPWEKMNQKVEDRRIEEIRLSRNKSGLIWVHLGKSRQKSSCRTRLQRWEWKERLHFIRQWKRSFLSGAIMCKKAWCDASNLIEQQERETLNWTRKEHISEEFRIPDIQPHKSTRPCGSRIFC